MGGARAYRSRLGGADRPLGRAAGGAGLRGCRRGADLRRAVRSGTASRDAAGGCGCPPRFHRLPPRRNVAAGRRTEPDARGAKVRARRLVGPGPPGPRAGVTGGGQGHPAADRSECESSPRHGSHAARPARPAPGMSRVFVTLPLPSPGIDMLRERFKVTMMEAEGMPPETLKRHIAEADPVGIVGMVNVPITDEIMAAAPHLRVVANYAVGYNNVDVAAATRRGVLVTNTPGVLTDATADLAFALILAVARRVVESDRFLREGKFKGWKADLLLGSDVYGRVLGIIGFGRIGQAVARRGLGFNMSILYSDARRASPEVESELRAQYVPLDELLRKADYVTIHADLNDQTRHMIGERELKLMGPQHYLINAARGPIVV